MAKNRPKSQAAGQPTFEESLEQLEEIASQLEEGEIGLNNALQKYEQGVKLLRQCYELLQGAERRIEILVGVDANGNPVTREMDAESSPAEDAGDCHPEEGVDPGPPPQTWGGKPGKTDMDSSEGLF